MRGCVFGGLRNSELARVRLQDVDLDQCKIHVVQGKGDKDRSVLFPTSFRGELAQYIQGLQDRRAVYLFELNRLRPYSSRRIRQIVHEYAQAAGIRKRVYPHLFRHQIITFLTKKGILSPKLQLLSGHAEEEINERRVVDDPVEHGVARFAQGLNVVRSRSERTTLVTCCPPAGRTA